MITLAATALWIVLSAIAVLHVIWGLGSHWPAASAERLAKAAVGRPNTRAMPGATSCFVVAALLTGISVWPLFAVGILPEAWPRWLTLLAGVGIAAVFLARGIAGYVPAWRRLHSAEPFATFDRRYYAPLCFALGAGFLIILLSRGLQ